MKEYICRKCKESVMLADFQRGKEPIFVCDDCRSKHKVEIAKVEQGAKNIFFTFKDKPYTVVYGKQSGELRCD